MNLTVRGRHLELSTAIDAYARRRLRLAIGAFLPRITRVELRLGDVNGPRGGVDKTCVIGVSGHRLGPVVARATDADAYSAIDRAAARMRETLIGHRRRLHTKRRDARAVRADQTQ